MVIYSVSKTNCLVYSVEDYISMFLCIYPWFWWNVYKNSQNIKLKKKFNPPYLGCIGLISLYNYELLFTSIFVDTKTHWEKGQRGFPPPVRHSDYLRWISKTLDYSVIKLVLSRISNRNGFKILLVICYPFFFSDIVTTAYISLYFATCALSNREIVMSPLFLLASAVIDTLRGV